MRTSRRWWWLTGVAVGALGLAISYLVAGLLRVRESPPAAVAEAIRDVSPDGVVEWAKTTLGAFDKPVVWIGIFVFLVVAFAAIGHLARARWWFAIAGLVALGAIAGIALVTRPAYVNEQLVPLIVGFVAWLIALPVIAGWLRRWELVAAAEDAETDPTHSRRGFFVAVGSVGGLAILSGILGRFAANPREQVERDRRLLRVDEVTKPIQPRGAKLDVRGIQPWQTSAEDFYLIDTAFVKPAIRVKDWQLRIHGKVDREITLTYDDLVARGIMEEWITLNCVSNQVGGDLVGNAWWSGVPLRAILEEAGPHEDADAVLQTSDDGWTCGTPLAALMDEDRNAMLAVYMNGEPLTIEHGFPVRTLVPGLYGYVSACKWVVDMEVSSYDEIEAYWTSRGWSEEGPVKIASRIDVPADGDDVSTGTLVCGGSAWKQHVGIASVEVSLDGGAWTPATLGNIPSDDTWVQWRVEIEVEDGDHELRVRAIGKDDDVQTGVESDVLPNGATGWHSVDFSAS